MFLFINSLLFNFFFFLWTFLVCVFCYPLLFILGAKKIALIGWLWGKVSVWLLHLFCFLKLEIRGLEHLPSKPFIVAAKHQSDLETIAFHVILNKPVYVLKKELLSLPLFGTYLTKMGMIAIDRAGGMSALKDMLKKVATTTLEAQRPVVIFPQGTRTDIGQQAPYQVGISALYNTGNYHVVPVALNTGKFWAKGGFIKKPGTYVIEFLPPIAPGLAKEEFMQKLETQIETSSAALL